MKNSLLFYPHFFISDNHEKYTYLETLRYECYAGYKLANDNHFYHITCGADGKFTEMLECLPVPCPDITVIDNGNASKFYGFYMDQIEFNCIDGLVCSIDLNIVFIFRRFH